MVGYLISESSQLSSYQVNLSLTLRTRLLIYILSSEKHFMKVELYVLNFILDFESLRGIKLNLKWYKFCCPGLTCGYPSANVGEKCREWAKVKG